MIILSTQERKYETKTFYENFAKKVRTLPFVVPGNVKQILARENYSVHATVQISKAK
jgi:hypothetical protein